jgi:hypothetical protein
MRRVLLASVVGLLSILLLSPPASAAETQATDPVNDVPYDRGDLIFYRAIHRSANVDLRVRTERGGNPEMVWPNLNTRIRWRIDVGPPAGPEYYADIQIARGVDVVMLGRVRRVSDNQVVCQAQNHVSGNNIVIQTQNVYRFQFLRGCIGAPNSFRARATFIWDNAAPGGTTYIDYAPNGGPTAPITSSP